MYSEDNDTVVYLEEVPLQTLPMIRGMRCVCVCVCACVCVCVCVCVDE